METKNFVFVVSGVAGVISVGSGTRWWSSGVQGMVAHSISFVGFQ